MFSVLYNINTIRKTHQMYLPYKLRKLALWVSLKLRKLMWWVMGRQVEKKGYCRY